MAEYGLLQTTLSIGVLQCSSLGCVSVRSCVCKPASWSLCLQEGPAALLSPPQGLLHASPVQAPPLQPPQHCSAELLQALMRSAGATRQRGLHQDTLCGALPVQYLQRPQQQLWRGRGGADTAVAHGLEGAAMACAPPVRCRPQQALVSVCLLVTLFWGTAMTGPLPAALPTAGTPVCLWLRAFSWRGAALLGLLSAITPRSTLNTDFCLPPLLWFP